MRWLLFVLLEFDGKATRIGVEKIVFRLQIFGHRSGNHAAVERKKGEEGIWQSLTVSMFAASPLSLLHARSM